MKQRLLLSALSLLTLAFVACSKDKNIDMAPKRSLLQNSENPYQRSIADAKNCVFEFLSNNPSLRSVGGASRDIEKVLDLTEASELRATPTLSEFADNFYVVTFRDQKGYAVVSKDKRCFPIFAVLDSGSYDSRNLYSKEMLTNVQNMLAGARKEKMDYQKDLNSNSTKEELRGNTENPWDNTENAIQDMLNDGWQITRATNIRLNTTWRQAIKRKGFYINSQGVPFSLAYSPENIINNNTLRSSASETDAFGCTPVAFTQVMYALREFPGFNTLTYSNGEKVLWDRISPSNSFGTIENQRFIGWFTANCNPTYFDKGTMVYNITATKLLRRIIGDNIVSRYDNCIVGEGDFDGYGWSEDRRLAEDFFKRPHAFIIMTGSSGSLNYWDYHTYVIDGMVEFKKRIRGGGFLGLFKSWKNGIRHLYHINAGWGGYSNGYYLYVQNVGNEFKYKGTNDALNYRSKIAYLVLWPSQEN